MKHFLVATFLFSFLISFSQQKDPLQTVDVESQKKWVDSVLNTMTLDQKIGQLFMVAAYSNKDEKHEKQILELIEKYHLGSLIFFQDLPVKQAELTNKYQAKSKIPMLIGIDGEWGLNMRLKKTFRYPWNMTLGAVQDNKLIEEFGKQVGEHCNRLGIHMNFAPVVDVNTNPKNPIIGNRSFGENQENVAQKSIAFTKGMQSMNVVASAKHFPGHGDTAADSHHTLPLLDFNRKRLDEVELYPYRKIIDEGIASIMVAHLSIPILEPQEEIPSSLSKNVVTDLLQDELGFKGLIITDALNMKGSANFASSADVNLGAILAGNDLLDVPLDVPGTFKRFHKALESGELTLERLEHSVRKILKTKYWAGLHKYEPIKIEGLLKDLNTSENEVLFRDLVESSMTLLKNDDEIFPIRSLEKQKIAYVKLGDSDNATFIKYLKKYTNVDVAKSEDISSLIEGLKPYDLVIVGYHKSNVNPWKSFKFSEKELEWLEEISKNNKVILDVFASPYSLLQIKDFRNIESVLLSYQNSEVSQEISAQMIFGALSAKGKIPVSIKNEFKEGDGLFSSNLLRLGYAMPEKVGMNSEKLKRIDSIFKLVIDEEMAPGGQVLVARFGKVLYHKNFGFHTYSKKKEVELTDVYDLASLTKILGGLPMIMKSYEDDLFQLDSELGELLPYLKGSNKDSLTMREVLSHNARLQAWIPYYVETLDSISKDPLVELYSSEKSKDYSIQVSKDLYLRNSFTDTIYKRIYESDLREKSGYKYSGLVFYLFKRYLKDTYGKGMDELNNANFYDRLGASTLDYNPVNNIDLDRIVPSEVDNYFRRDTLHGYVHDMGAAMFNGVSGNAGLFGNSIDVAKMMQMYLQKGYYGGDRFLSPETIEVFNTRHFLDEDVRRGLGFDKPQLDDESMATCGCMSDKSFGHSGFTGTYAWADPKTQLVYVFLSNRVYPTMDNNKLGEENIRTEIQQYIVDAIVE
ncbi:glycoside hydrolase family 3 N-terminal domain-containing protein [Urechidicola vernalis]|uniref:beta-N-acetylhexosaminidase n=1 Tax=Urechidicola vernalis TaxID=3075600 RepID=A0ABU2Y2M6_9FLAO|nr:glycoside hydrolase family 3 N-terminal domain-containing protein [Urechidicola sp. P050]MDT0552458.1 glycoside hydrolase family 3 N-terminal domain-containing protein [Urechidicola sp. P050]